MSDQSRDATLSTTEWNCAVSGHTACGPGLKSPLPVSGAESRLRVAVSQRSVTDFSEVLTVVWVAVDTDVFNTQVAPDGVNAADVQYVAA